MLVTGASGFVGSRTLAPLLAAGHEVHAVARTLQPGAGEDTVVWHEADLLDASAVTALLEESRPQSLLHLAWYAEPGLYWRSPQNLAWVSATLALLREFSEAGGERAVLAGTCAEYDWSKGGLLIEASTPVAPATLYGTCKHAAHLIAAAFAEEAGLRLAWARLFFLYGPGEQEARMVPQITRALLSGREAQATVGTQVRDFMHVEDAGAALAAVLDSRLHGAVNIATGTGVAVREIIEMIAAAAGNAELVRLGALPLSPQEPEELVGDARVLREEAGFVPAIGLEQGIAETVQWWRERLSAP